MHFRDFTPSIMDVWERDGEFQNDAMQGIVQNIRKVTDPSIGQLQVDYLKNLGAFYVPTNNYMKEYFGPDITNREYGIYNITFRCNLLERLAIPIRFMNGRVVGFIGYSSKPTDWPADKSWIKYLYPSSDVLRKERYFFIEPQEYRKALADDYICIVDGLFDKMILQALGVNAVSLCGSALTVWHRYYLSFIKHKIVIGDNDQAGRKLFATCRSALSGCVEIRQPYTNDIDDFLKEESRIKVLLDTISEMKSEGFLISKTLKEVKPKVDGRTDHF